MAGLVIVPLVPLVIVSIAFCNTLGLIPLTGIIRTVLVESLAASSS